MSGSCRSNISPVTILIAKANIIQLGKKLQYLQKVSSHCFRNLLLLSSHLSCLVPTKHAFIRDLQKGLVSPCSLHRSSICACKTNSMQCQLAFIFSLAALDCFSWLLLCLSVYLFQDRFIFGLSETALGAKQPANPTEVSK